MSKYAASSIQPAAAQLLASHGLYTSSDSAAEKPPRTIKLVHGAVTYFRIIGTIRSMFRARPFLVGAEGEVVIDLAEVDRFDSAGQKEWRRRNGQHCVPAWFTAWLGFAQTVATKGLRTHHVREPRFVAMFVDEG